MTTTAQLNKNQLFTVRRQSYAPGRPTPQSLSADVEAFLASGGRINVLPGFQHDAIPLPCSKPQPYPSARRPSNDDELLTLNAVAELAGMERKVLEVLIASGRGPDVQRRSGGVGRVLLRVTRREAKRWMAERAGRRGLV
jgi:hypothetical protein